MALADGQIQVRDLVMGAGTPYEILSGTNPFVRNARSDQGGPRPRAHGTWAGPEWMAEAVVPLQILVKAGSAVEWLTRHDALQAAFRPVGPGQSDVELRFALAGREFVMFGRPRMVEPDMQTYSGDVLTRCAFVALDPLRYSADEHVALATMAEVAGGLTLPFSVPFSVQASVTEGRARMLNAGNAEVGLRLRIFGPVVNPRVTVVTGDGTTRVLRLNLTVDEGQWLEIDTSDRARTVYLNGTASRRGAAAADRGEWPTLPPGQSELVLSASTLTAAYVTATWRDAWY